MTDAAIDTLVQGAWADQARWSDTASCLKRGLERGRLLALGAGALGGVLETAAATLHDLKLGVDALQPLLAVSGAVLLAVVPIVLTRVLTKEKVAAWTRCRATSERLKEAIYRYLLGAAPFGPSATPLDFVDRCQAIKNDAAGVAGHTALTAAVPRPRPLSLDVTAYLAERVTGQIDGFYLRKARERAHSARRLHAVELLFAVLAAALGVFAGLGKVWPGADLSLLGPWVAVCSGLGASFTAHLAAVRHDHEAALYTATAGLLASLRERWLADPERQRPERVAALVDACERAIAAENGSWLAEWQREPAGKG